MKSGDWAFALVMCIVLTILGVSLFNIDSTDWQDQYNGCVVRVDYDNSVWHTDHSTQMLYCPVGVDVHAPVG